MFPRALNNNNSHTNDWNVHMSGARVHGLIGKSAGCCGDDQSRDYRGTTRILNGRGVLAKPTPGLFALHKPHTTDSSRDVTRKL